ncbi:MAG TPA: gliding motility-associated ABC transporter ATP-binding subunit GldA [Cytophagaceae bacterium]
MSIIVSNLSKVYGNQNAVDGISFTAKPGEILGFLGPNGAGKSTTMKIATCFIPPSSGSVTVQGFDVVSDPMKVKKIVGYLPEHNPLYLDMYVHEYLGFVGRLHKLAGTSLKRRICEVIGICGLALEQRKKIGALSKGYRQRVGLAQALIHDPKVLILDEPTTGLDPNQIHEIRNLISALGREKTVIFSTHILQEVQAICDRVVIINKGKIVADDKVAALQNVVGELKIISASFAEEISIEEFTNIPGVVNVEQKGKGKFDIFCKPDADVRKEIFLKASNLGWNLLELKQEERSLESIFRELTGRDQ